MAPLVSEAQFYSGMSWGEYLASMQANRELLRRKRAEFVLPAAERERWARTSVAHVLVFTEDWCQDSISALPPLLAIADIAPFDLRVMRRSDSLPLMRALTGQEYPAIPMFLFYDHQWWELGRFIEMPREVRRMKEDPAEAFWLQEMYDQVWWEAELEELAAIAGRAS